MRAKRRLAFPKTSRELVQDHAAKKMIDVVAAICSADVTFKDFCVRTCSHADAISHSLYIGLGHARSKKGRELANSICSVCNHALGLDMGRVECRAKPTS